MHIGHTNGREDASIKCAHFPQSITACFLALVLYISYGVLHTLFATWSFEREDTQQLEDRK